MKALWEQTKATTNGRTGLTVFTIGLILPLVMVVLFVVAMSRGALTLALVLGACTVGLELLMPAVMAIAQGYRPVEDSDAVLSATDGLWHTTAQQWEVGDTVVFDHRRCRLRSCVQQSSRPFALPRRAVYFFTTNPERAHVLGNVARSRARYLYQLADPKTDGSLFQRGIAIAVAGDVTATVADRRDLPN